MAAYDVAFFAVSVYYIIVYHIHSIISRVFLQFSQEAVCLDARFTRNIGTLSAREQDMLRASSAAVLGLGGLGGYVAEHLVRMGLGRLTFIDGDTFEESNLNRQLYADLSTLGRSKAETAKERALRIAPGLSVSAVARRFDQDGTDLLSGHDIVCDCLDNLDSRRLLERVCAARGLPWVHGAVGGLTCQIIFVRAGAFVLDKIYPRDRVSGSVLSPTVGMCAAVMASQAALYLTGRLSSDFDLLHVFDLSVPECRTIKI